MNLRWYARRLASMSPVEMAGRARDELTRRRWRRRQVTDAGADPAGVPAVRPAFAALLPVAGDDVPEDARVRLKEAAEGLLGGRWPVFARERDDMAPAPDWFLDPHTGRRAPDRSYCFAIDHRDTAAVGNVKYVWELSRHQHLTVLAAAYRLDGDERYAEAVATQLRSWWAANPFLSGIHWTSGIELGLRLLSWVWIRRLLDGWDGAGPLFEGNRTFLQQLHHHQEWLARLPSHGSSANNHLLAEMAGQFAAGCAFPWFPESSAWREAAATKLRRELVRQTFASGLNRELATDYHGFVLELGLAAALEGELAGHPLGDQVWDALRRMTDALAAVVDVRLRPPRQGDADDGHGLLLDGPGYDRWASLLATGAALFGPASWWPAGYGGDARTALWTPLAVRPLPGGPGRRGGRRCSPTPAWPSCATPTAGPTSSGAVPTTALTDTCRSPPTPTPTLWPSRSGWAGSTCSRTRGPTATAPTRPGAPTSAPRWPTTPSRSAASTSPWRPAPTSGPARPGRARERGGLDGGPVAEWRAAHHGYRRLRPPAVHRRSVRLDRRARQLVVEDRLDGGAHDCRLAFHLGPDVACTLERGRAVLDGATATADGARRSPSPTSSSGGAWRARPTRPWAGTRPRSAYGCPRSRCSGAAGSVTAGP